MTGVWRPTIKLAVFAAVAVVLLAAVITAIQRPVPGATDRYGAMFTDASGLKPGDDVRMYGVEIGKVESVRLDGTLARVEFTVVSDRDIHDTSRPAIRYKNLTGQRYLDIGQSGAAGVPIAPGTTIDEAHTVPSFDVTVLFNGLRPVLADYSADALDHLTQSLIAVIEGDQRGVGPALDSLAALSEFAADRQSVISVLIENLARVSASLGGKSPQTVVLLTQLANLFDELQRKVDGVVDFALTAPAIMAPLDSLLASVGLTPSRNEDLDDLVRTAFPDPAVAVDVLGRLPGLLQALTAALSGPVETATCSRGEATLPSAVSILVAGQRVTVCR